MFILTHWKAILVGIGASALILFMLHYEHLREKADQLDTVQKAYNDYVASAERSHTIGLDLINGNNTYAEKIHAIDQERAALPVDMPDPKRLRLRNARNAAGKAARASIQ